MKRLLTLCFFSFSALAEEQCFRTYDPLYPQDEIIEHTVDGIGYSVDRAGHTNPLYASYVIKNGVMHRKSYGVLGDLGGSVIDIFWSEAKLKLIDGVWQGRYAGVARDFNNQVNAIKFKGRLVEWDCTRGFE